MTDREIIAGIAPIGKLRVAINYGNPVLAQRNKADQPKGISAALATELAKELNVDIEWVTFDAAGQVFASIDDHCWDIAFLAIDPLRSEKIAFSQPYVTIAGTYLVHEDAPFKQVADLDQPDVTISVGRGAAYDLYLSRTLKHAQFVRGETSLSAIELFVAGQSNAAAGVRQPLQAYADEHEGFRVVLDDFTTINQAMAVPRNHTLAAAYISAFVTRKKQEGFIKAALVENGQPSSLAAQ
ncbi:MAG: transporter substrate-binding domain-containing protein [Pantoea sp.]|uniref:transporter substrate-binding domain-containing protein n=1 Tax=Pantoea sp. TaxID=69393 RepID=UPI0039E5D723